ncbi:hypothetical protein ACHAWF_016593 [Thalassiosira exigua]
MKRATMKRAISSGSSGDEFFDAVSHIDSDDSNNFNCNANAKEEKRDLSRLQSLGESSLEGNSQSSDPPKTQLQETEELWASAQAFPSCSRSSASLVENVPADGVQSPNDLPTPHSQETEECWVSARSFPLYSTSSTSVVDYVPPPCSNITNENNDDAGNRANSSQSDPQIKENEDSDTSRSDATYAETETNEADEDNLSVPPAPSSAPVPPVRLSLVSGDRQNIYTVPTEEMKDIIRRQYDEQDVQTLNKLVSKLQAVESCKSPSARDLAKAESGNIDDSTITARETPTKEKVVYDVDPQTPVSKIDCGDCITSPLEAFYLLCPGKSETSIVDGREEDEKDAVASPVRTSVSEEDSATEGLPQIPSDEEGLSGSQLNLDSDSSGDDSSSDSSSRFQMINKDTGSKHDMRQVMRQIEEVGSSDALDTKYSFLPTKGQLEFRRHMSYRTDSMDIDGNDRAPPIPLAVASFDSAHTEDTSKASELKKNAVKLSNKIATSKMAANVRKGVAGLKSSQQRKRNRKRTASVDVVPSNAIYVRSSSRQKQSKQSTSEHTLDDPDSSFNPMLLIRTVPDAHKGPAWCASFSLNGRYLATAGEDGNVCIWAVSPKSKYMHPNGIANNQPPETQKEMRPDQEKTDDIKETTSDENQNDATTPPLQFIGTGLALATDLEILSSDPIQRFKDHTADVIDLSWSHTNFLLSASLDSTVRLYHFSKPGCLHLFKHANLVASVAFHPHDDRLFISGGIDKKLRLWDITDGRVKDWAQSPDVITAARFTPDGRYAVAGLFHGQVYFYDMNNRLKYYTQIACRNRSGKNRMGKKVTGISFIRGERDDWVQAKQKSAPEQVESSSQDNHGSTLTRLSGTGKDVAKLMTSAFRHKASRAEALRYTERMLVSTNDSRVRLYGLNDFQLVRKYKGHTNCSMQIRARNSESGSHIVSGSESGHVFIWDLLDKNRPKKSNVSLKVHQSHDKTRRFDSFEASKADLPIVTDTVFFPSRSVNEALLSSDKVFPFELGIDRVDDDRSNAAILTLDYSGCLRIFLRKSCIDNILDAATPRGGTMA